MKEIYLFCNGCSHQWHEALAICEDGHVLGSHVCSDHAYIPGDLGFTPEMDWSNKRKAYAEHCPDGFVTVYLERGEAKDHAGLKRAYALNQELGRVAKESK